MQRSFVELLSFCLSASLMLAAPHAAAQTTVNELITSAYDGSDPSLSLSRETGRESQHPLHSPITLLTRDDVPIYAFAERWMGEDYAPVLGFACEPGEEVAIHLVLQMSTLSEASDINPQSRHSVLVRPYGNNRRVEIPVEFISWFDIGFRRYASFQGTISAHNQLIRGLTDTSNLQFNLKENGANTHYSAGVEIDNVASHLRPLLDHCSGYSAPSAEPPEELPEVSYWSPGEDEIKWALQTELDSAVRQFDALREQCNNVGQSGDPFQALACIVGTVSGISSDEISFTVNSVELNRCVRAVDGTTYCNYRVDADIRGAGVAAQMVQNAQNFAETVGDFGWGSFRIVDGRWHLERVYIDCTIGDTDINCTYER